ncbi:MAG: diaminopropionate ammonia-lyase [Acidimicrobiales bacterium]
MTDIFHNPARRPYRPGAGPGPGPYRLHRRLPGYRPTPLVPLPSVAGELGLAELWVKDETRRLGLPSFKILGASWATYRALCGRLGSEPDWADIHGLRAALSALGPFTLAAATDGNHGRAVARMARLLGMDASILVPAGTAEARITAIRSEGAKVTVVDGTYDDAVAASAALEGPTTAVISDTSWDGYTEVPQWVIDGYSTIFREVDDQMDARAIDLVVVQVGVGALASAVIDHYADHCLIVSVEPLSAACALRSARAGEQTEVPGPHRSIMAGLNCGNVSQIAWPALRTGVDEFVAIDDRAAEGAMRDLAAVGLDSGESGAAGLAGLQALASAGTPPVDLRGRSALVLCTEGPTDPDAWGRIVGREPAALEGAAQVR